MNDLYIIANFGEIFLKGGNIRDFEKRLFRNLKEQLEGGSGGAAATSKNFFEKVKFERKSGGSFWIKISSDLSEEEILKIEKIIAHTPGFANFYRAYFTESTLEKISELAVKLSKKELENKKIRDFGIFAERIEKNVDFSSKDVGMKVGSAVWKGLDADENKISVNLTNPDLAINIKIRNEKTFLFLEKQAGVGGLPVGSSGKAIAMFSGGIDSPVAAYLAMKRGLEITAIHFHSVPQTSPESIEKVKTLVNELKKYQKNIKLILVPILDIQKEIAKNCDEKLRLVLLRRMFLKVAQEINYREKIKAKAFITGDSLGQVASQTLENMIVTGEAVKNALLYRPLIAFDKIEIMDLARKIETYNISILPHDDSCSLFTPKKPETKANLSYTLSEEEKIDLEKLIPEVLEKIEVVG